MITIDTTKALTEHGLKKAEEIEKAGGDPGAWAKWDEAHLIYSILIAQKTTTAYEAGTCNGWSASWMALAMTHALETANYPPEVSKYGDAPPRVVELGHVYTWDVKSKPLIYEGTSLEPQISQQIGEFHEGVGSAISKRKHGGVAVFIDGLHGTENCKGDFYAVEPHLQVNDVVLFHDVRRLKYVGILDFFEELCRHEKYEGISFHHTRNGIAVMRKKHKE